MIAKVLLVFLLCLNLSFASFEKVRIGKIDPYYEDKINKEQLLEIILNIKNTFDSQLGFPTFEYTALGKDIDLVYLAPSKLSLKISKLKNKIKNKSNEITSLKNSYMKDKPTISKNQKKITQKSKNLNNKVKLLNRYIKKKNKEKIKTKAELTKIKAYIKVEKNKIDKLRIIFKKGKKDFDRFLKNYNKKITTFNKSIKIHNRYQEQLRRLTKGRKEVKGVTKGYKRIEEKTYYKNGKKIKTRTQTNYMKKIEIYGFKTLKELKAILAHELGHLVGVKHVNFKKAVMNPILQKEQIKKLFLTKQDIKSFKKVFNK